MSAVDHYGQRALDAVASDAAVGAALAIDVAGTRIATLAAGFQDIEQKRHLQPDMLFQVGSQTKMIVAAAIHLLVKDKALSLDGDINAILPEVGALTGGRRIAVSQLLNHSSGLGNFTDLMAARGWVRAGWPLPTYSDDDLLVLAATMGFAFMPGEGVAYCNTGYILLGRIIERVTGEPSTAFLKRRVLDPIGMTDTHFARGGCWPRDRAATGGVIRAVGPLSGVAERDDPPDMSWASSAGDALSSLDQMLGFLSAVMGKDTALAIGLEDFMARPIAVTDPWILRDLVSAFGYGMEQYVLAGRSWWGHTGGTATQLSATICCPELSATISTAITYVADARAPAKSEPLLNHLRMILHLAAHKAEQAS